jgi:hypothetical protein
MNIEVMRLAIILLSALTIGQSADAGSYPSPITEPAAIIGEIERNDAGNIFLTDRFHIASSTCQRKGLRLPTAREYAQYAATLGAMTPMKIGFREPSSNPWGIPYEKCGLDEQSIRDSMKANGYGEIHFVLSLYPKRDEIYGGYKSCLAVDFYYNSKGYKAPANELSQNEFWTLNEIPTGNDSGCRNPCGSAEYYAFSGNIGEFLRLPPRAERAVRCVKN